MILPHPYDLAAFAHVAAFIPPRIPEPLVLAQSPSRPREDWRLSPHEATALLSADAVVHVIDGADRSRWSRDAAVAALRDASAIRLTLGAHEVGFGLAVERRGEPTILMQTDRSRVRAWIAQQAARALKE